MKPEIGDKYIIEIDRAYASKKHTESRYGIKGFENFVLSKRNISNALKYGNIEPLADHDTREGYKEYQRGYEDGSKKNLVSTMFELSAEEKEKEYRRGLNDAWDAALFALHGIDGNVETMLDEISLFGAIDALKEYEQKKTAKTNADKFREVFGLEADTDLYLPEEWLNSEFLEPESEGEDDQR